MKNTTRFLKAMLVIAIPFLLIITAFPTNVSATTISRIGVSGTSLTNNGTNISSTMVGVDETTLLDFAVLAYCEGQSMYWGKNMNFPTFANDHLQVSNLTSLFYSFFWFCNNYNLSWVRLSCGDDWSSEIMYEAWTDHQILFFQLIDELMYQAYLAKIYISLNIAGIQGNYAFGGTGSVYSHSHVVGTAYSNYLAYATSIIQHCDASPYTNCIFSYDLFNEPDSNNGYTNYWLPTYSTKANAQSAFHSWAYDLANDTTSLTTHIVEMGVGEGGTFFGWGQTSFNTCTGNTGFDVTHRHVYGSAQDDYLVKDPIHWANDTNKPINTGEIANNHYYPVHVWPWWSNLYSHNGGDSFAWMDLVGMNGYPYYGEYPIWDTNVPINQSDPTPNPIYNNVTINTTSVLVIPPNYAPAIIGIMSAFLIFMIFAIFVENTMNINLFHPFRFNRRK